MKLKLFCQLCNVNRSENESRIYLDSQSQFPLIMKSIQNFTSIRACQVFSSSQSKFNPICEIPLKFSATMSSTIEKLPDNLLKIVADYLNPRDVMNLSMCSKVLYNVSGTWRVQRHWQSPSLSFTFLIFFVLPFTLLNQGLQKRWNLGVNFQPTLRHQTFARW